MTTRWLAVLMTSLVIGLAGAGASHAQSRCEGGFVNPIGDICWDCMFPLSVGGLQVSLSGNAPDTDNPTLPICLCSMPTPPFVRMGIAVGFWEPIRLLDVSKRPWCFVNLGGIRLDPGFDIGDKGRTFIDGRWSGGQYHVHYYVYPLFYWLELLADAACLERGQFDIAYISELDPLWQDDELSYLIHPESILFGNLLAQAACVADCATVTTTGRNVPGMYWCAGCHGSIYPMNGNIQRDATRVQGAALAAERMVYKMHRQLLAYRTSGSAALCQRQLAPIWPREQYRFQLVNPNPHVSGPGTCPRVGVSTVIYESGRTWPATGEDVGFLLWRKRNCCAF